MEQGWKTTEETIREYQRSTDQNDRSIVSILCDYIEAIQPDSGAGYGSHLEEYLDELDPYLIGEDG